MGTIGFVFKSGPRRREQSVGVADQEGWVKWRQLGSFLSPTLVRGMSALAVTDQEGWAKWRQLASFKCISCYLSPAFTADPT